MRWRARWRSTTWAGYAACAWAVLFAAMSFYWAAGGNVGIETQAPGIADAARARDPSFVELLWGTGVLKMVAAVVALALVQPWGRALPRWLLLTAGWTAGGVMTLWGGLNLLIGFAVAVLSAAGAVRAPADRSAFWWHLLLWDPWWLIGGVLFLAATWAYQRSSNVPNTTRADARR